MANKNPNPRKASLWNEEYDLLLQKLWNQDLEVKDIGRRLGLRFTRPSIHGRVNRLRKKGMTFKDRSWRFKGVGLYSKASKKVFTVTSHCNPEDVMEDMDNLCSTEAEKIGLAGNRLGLFSGDFSEFRTRKENL